MLIGLPFLGGPFPRDNLVASLCLPCDEAAGRGRQCEDVDKEGVELHCGRWQRPGVVRNNDCWNQGRNFSPGYSAGWRPFYTWRRDGQECPGYVYNSGVRRQLRLFSTSLSSVPGDLRTATKKAGDILQPLRLSTARLPRAGEPGGAGGLNQCRITGGAFRSSAWMILQNNLAR